MKPIQKILFTVWKIHQNGELIYSSGGNINTTQRGSERENGNKKKVFQITSKIYRLMQSSAVNMFEERKHKVVFLTFTLPTSITEKQATESFSRFLDNAKKTYNLKSFIYVKEIGQNNNVHFHGLLEIPYFDFDLLKRAWYSAYSRYSSDFHNNNIRVSEKHGAIVETPEQAIKYVCKYASKSRGRGFESRCYGISRNIRGDGREVGNSTAVGLIDTLAKTCYKGEYFAIYKLDRRVTRSDLKSFKE